MEVNELQKYLLANRIQSSSNSVSLIKKLENLELPSNVKCIKKEVAEIDHFKIVPENYKIAIIDFEGSPVFLCGILIHSSILVYYIEKLVDKIDLYLTIFKILKVTYDLIFFSFSDHERIELLNLYRYLRVQEIDVSEFEFIITFPIVNLQKNNSKFESLQEAIYSLNSKATAFTGDALFRNNKLVNTLFTYRKFDEVISHNINCLLNGALLFLKRWYKNYKL